MFVRVTINRCIMVNKEIIVAAIAGAWVGSVTSTALAMMIPIFQNITNMWILFLFILFVGGVWSFIVGVVVFLVIKAFKFLFKQNE